MIVSKTALFRVDASAVIGSGHLMRCLTLAKALQQSNWQVQFACRAHPGHLIQWLQDQSFDVITLQQPPDTKASGCLLYTSPSPRDVEESRMPSSA